MEKIFILASRNKTRFNFKGLISTEDLWDLNVNQLDSIYSKLKAEQKTKEEETLLKSKTKNCKELETKIEIIKYIVSIKLDEKEKANKAKEVKEKKQKILEIMNNKKDEELLNKSPEELQEILDSM